MNSHNACLQTQPKRSVRFIPTPRTFLRAFRAILLAAVCHCAASTAFAAAISGAVTASGTGVGGISVDVYIWDGESSFGILAASVLTAPDGTYTAPDLAAGNYRVGFRDNGGDYAPVFYDNAGDIQSATDLPLTAAQAASGINAALVAASSIGGTVTAADGNTPLESIAITAFRQVGSDWEFVGGQITDANGVYLITGLAAGSYRLEFNDALGAYAGEFYNNKSSLAAADTVSVPASSAEENINASLSAGSSISGTVTGPGGAPLFFPISINALAYSAAQGSWITAASASTDAAGNYTITGLSAGTYRVEFFDISGNYASEYYDDVTDVDAASNVAVGVATTTSGINAALSLSGYDTWASGYALDPAMDGAPSADPDKDGFRNGSEYAFGTDPTLSTPALLYSARSGGDLTVSYVGKNVGVAYLAETTSDLKAGAWSNVSVQPTLDPDQDGVPPSYSRQILSITGSGKLFLRIRASWN